MFKRSFQVCCRASCLILLMTHFPVFSSALPTIDCAKQVVLTQNHRPTLDDQQRDSYCAYQFLQRYAPHGMLMVFGGETLEGSNREDYLLIQEFARRWTYSKASYTMPIVTGGAQGVMQAATLGARQGRKDAIVLSLDVAIDIQGQVQPIGKYDIVKYTFVYRDISKREGDMINYANALVFGLGGIGTTWELMETLVKITLGKISPVPIVILAGSSQREFIDILHILIDRQFVQRSLCQYVNYTSSVDKALALISMSFEARKKDSTNLCHIKVHSS